MLRAKNKYVCIDIHVYKYHFWCTNNREQQNKQHGRRRSKRVQVGRRDEDASRWNEEICLFCFFCLMTIIDYCRSARIIRFKTAVGASFPLEDPSPSLSGAAVVPTTLADVVVFLRPVRERRFVVAFSPLKITIEPAGTCGKPPFIDGVDVDASPDGMTGATDLTFETIQPKQRIRIITV
jgi:hypothetical protein